MTDLLRRGVLHAGTTAADGGSGGHETPSEKSVEVLEELTVGEVMETNLMTLHEADSLAIASDLFARTHHHGLLVVDSLDRLAGILTVHAIERAQAVPSGLMRAVGDVCTRDLLVTYPDESVGAALRSMSTRDVGRLPAVARDDPRRPVGILRRANLVRAYDIALTRRTAMRHRAHQAQLSAATGNGVAVRELSVRAGAPCTGLRVMEVPWPRNCTIASLRRGAQVLIPDGNTRIEAGDVLVIVAEEGAVGAIHALCGPPQ